MNIPRVQVRLAAVALLITGITAGAGQVLADANGRTGKATSSTGCSCHATLRTPGVLVTIAGPQNVATSSTHQYTVTVSGGPAAPNGGFNLKASAGTLVAGANNRVSGLEVTHSDSNVRTWTFSWTAPATAGTQNFWAIGLAADGSGDNSGDDWNYYGNALNTAFPITVASAVGVGDSPSLEWIAPPLPNPCTSGTQITYSLASAAVVRLSVLDAAGRKVRTLVQGTRPAGRESVTWNGRGDNGSRVPSGVYFAQLALPGRVLSTRITVVD